MPHVSIAPYLDTADELYSHLQQEQISLERQLILQRWGLIALTVVALAGSGPISKAAICLVVLAGVRIVHGTMELVARNWFMHSITLHQLVRPQQNTTENVLAALLAIDEAVQVAGAGLQDMANAEADSDGSA